MADNAFVKNLYQNIKTNNANAGYSGPGSSGVAETILSHVVNSKPANNSSLGGGNLSSGGVTRELWLIVSICSVRVTDGFKDELLMSMLQCVLSSLSIFVESGITVHIPLNFSPSSLLITITGLFFRTVSP